MKQTILLSFLIIAFASIFSQTKVDEKLKPCVTGAILYGGYCWAPHDDFSLGTWVQVNTYCKGKGLEPASFDLIKTNYQQLFIESKFYKSGGTLYWTGTPGNQCFDGPETCHYYIKALYNYSPYYESAVGADNTPAQQHYALCVKKIGR